MLTNYLAYFQLYLEIFSNVFAYTYISLFSFWLNKKVIYYSQTSNGPEQAFSIYLVPMLIGVISFQAVKFRSGGCLLKIEICARIYFVHSYNNNNN